MQIYDSIVHKQISQIGEIMHNHRRRFLMFRDKPMFMQMSSVIDTIGQTELAINTFSICNYDKRDKGQLYLVIYGLLQGIFVQQDAVRHLCKILKIDENINKKHPRLEEIRDIRNAAAGHPTLKDRFLKGKVNKNARSEKGERGLEAYNFVSQFSLSKETFDLITYYNNGQFEQKKISTDELIADQQKFVSEILEEVLRQLLEEEQKHKQEFKSEKLTDGFAQVRYLGIEQITKGVFANIDETERWGIDNINFGIAGLEYLANLVHSFIDSVTRRDAGFAESIKDEFEEFRFATEKLRGLFSKKISRETISKEEQLFMSILLKYIETQMKTFEEYAKQLDDEYSE